MLASWPAVVRLWTTYQNTCRIVHISAPQASDEQSRARGKMQHLQAALALWNPSHCGAPGCSCSSTRLPVSIISATAPARWAQGFIQIQRGYKD